MPPPISPSLAERPRIRRAAVACEYCHARKVRCDAMVHGFPCTNCRLDDIECLKRAPKPKPGLRLMPSKKRSKVIYGIKENAVEAETTPAGFAIQAEPSMPAPVLGTEITSSGMILPREGT